MTTKRRKRRRIVKWTGAGLCVVILVAWYTSTGIGFYWEYGLSIVVAGRYSTFNGTIAWVQEGSFPFASSGWCVFTLYIRDNYLWPPISKDRHEIYCSVWLLLGVVALPTAFMFYRDRKRIPPGHCKKCGYNLTGAEHERCPECGAARAASGAAT